MITQQDIASVIRFHRKLSGLSQKELADIAGVGKTVVHDIEKGKETVKLVTFRKILKALNISIILESPLMNLYERETDEKGFSLL